MTQCALEIAFHEARRNKFDRMKLRYNNLVFSLAGINSINAGSIYVKTSDAVYLGKIRAGNFFASTGCILDLETRSNILYVMDHPFIAATKHGARTGSCSICGRTLHAEDSIRNNIGPICAEKFGFTSLIQTEDKETAKLQNNPIIPPEDF